MASEVNKSRTACSSPKTKVMVIQDFFASRNVITHILRQIGLRSVETDKDGGTALKRLKSEEYGIIISDWHMGGMDGLSLLKTVREDPELKEMIFIMVTAENDRDKVMEAKMCGVDGYVMKPFTAEALCRRIVAALKARYPETYKTAQQQSAKPASLKPKKPPIKIFGEAAKAGMSSPQNWSISLSHMSSKPQALIKSGFAEAISILSGQFDMMKTDDSFISIGEIIGKVEATITNAEKQAEHATLIANATDDINHALAAVETIPGGSPEAAEGLTIINQSATKLSDMIDSFDKEAADVIGMLNGMDHMVRQAHINEINDSIKASYDLEMGRNADDVCRTEEASEVSGKVTGRLTRIQAESETAREALTMAAGGITNVIERIKTFDKSARPTLELFQQLRDRIDNIMDSLDSQIDMAATLVTGVEEVAAVKKEVINPVEVKSEVPVQDKADTQLALKKLIKNRILMIDIIKTDHNLCLEKFRELLRDNADIELQQDQLPGGPACSISKWIDRQLTNKEFHDPEVCRQIAKLRGDMYVHSSQAFNLHQRGKKDEAHNSYQKANVLSDRIKGMLTKLQDDLRTRV